jgi:hypothetical protein
MMFIFLRRLMLWNEGHDVALEPSVHEIRRRLYFLRRAEPFVPLPWLPSVKLKHEEGFVKVGGIIKVRLPERYPGQEGR